MSDLVLDGGIFPCGRKYIPNRLDKRGVVIKLNYCGRGVSIKKLVVSNARILLRPALRDYGRQVVPGA